MSWVGERNIIKHIFDLEKSSSITILHDTIILKNVQEEQAGSYACIAVQQLGTFKNVQQRDMELIVEC